MSISLSIPSNTVNSVANMHDKRIIYSTALALMVTLSSFQVEAQTANTRGEQLQREQQIRTQRDIERALENRGESELELPAQNIPVPRDGRCLDIDTIDVTGSELLSEEDEQAIVEPFEYSCMSVSDIEKLMSELTRYFIESGYTTTRAYVPPQDLTKGTLLIEVEDGVVGDIQLNDSGKDSINLEGAFPGLKGEYFNIWEFEQGLDQVNRLRANNATLDILPGEAEGESIIEIQNDPLSPLYVTFGFENTGVRSTGREQASFSLNADNLLGLNEFMNFTRRDSLPLRRNNEFSTSDTFVFSVPYGHTLFSLVYATSRYESEFLAGALPAELSGTSRNITGTIEHTFYRDQTDILKLFTSFTAKRNLNFFNDQLLNVSSRRLSIWDVGLDYSTDFEGGVFSSRLSYSNGMHLFGALRDQDNIGSDVPRAQFRRYNLNASYAKAFEYEENIFTYSSALTAQYGVDTLYGTEQLAIGGPFSIRGFLDESLANDTGFFLRNEVSWNNASIIDPFFFHETPINFSPYIGMDVGGVTSEVANTPSDFLAGAFIGARASSGNVNFDAYVAHSLSTPDAITGEGPIFILNASVTF